mgnify:FL=1
MENNDTKDIAKVLNNHFKKRSLYVVKDLNSKYIRCSEAVAEEAGLNAPKEIKGKSDCDMIWRYSAESFIKADREITLHGKSQFHSLEMIRGVTGLHQVLVSKAGLRKGNGDLIAIISSNLIIDDLPIDIRKKNGKMSLNEERFYLGAFWGEKYITKREVQVLKCILHGFPAEKTAVRLNVSKKRIECIIKQLKQKLQCKSQLEIVNLAITQGWIYLLEEDLGIEPLIGKSTKKPTDDE